MVAAVGHEQHRFRRGILRDFFSRRAVIELSESVNERVLKLMERMEKSRLSQTPVRLDDAFNALTSDIITSYCCGKHWNFVEDQGFRNDLRKATADAIEFTHITRFVPWLVYAMSHLSPRTLSVLMPGKAALFEFLESFLEYGKTATLSDKRKTMVATLADPSIPPEERTYNRLRDETFALLAAGTETTARVLTVAFYHFAYDSRVREALQAELKQAMPTLESTPTLPELEQLPYLVREEDILLSVRRGSNNRTRKILNGFSLECVSKRVLAPSLRAGGTAATCCAHRVSLLQGLRNSARRE